MNKVHELKILPEYFFQVFSGNKLFELRKNDRNFGIGEFVKLREWSNGEYTGNFIVKKINYILKGGCYGLDEDYVILSLSARDYDNQIVGA